ncbi:MAG: UDP-N-acetylmuramoyl-tripeptide--D-alanyl-D-alanine ligase [Bacilli bacterium]|nr:UDP-N-acetylmuramoyl-tripeptide--D-alanyl-D-alanine ligase [Bacilli bacterium]
MRQLNVSDVLRECGGKLLQGNEDLELIHFSNDTRTIKANDVYLGIRGENFDGNQFYLEALKKGASCCILDRIEYYESPSEFQSRTIILVEDTVLALQKLAAYKRSFLDIPVVAVTGSAGKTSTKDMIAEILRQKYTVFKTPGNLNGQIGLPLSILEIQDEEVLVLEMGMNDFGQIAKLTKIAQPTMAVITNIGTAHIGILGSQENILKAKLEILLGMKPNSPLFFNGDDVLLKSVNLPDYNIEWCTMKSQDGSFSLKDVVIQHEVSHYRVKALEEEFMVEVPVMGNAFLMDSLLAIAVSVQLGVSSSLIQKGLKNFKLTGNRMEVIHHFGLTILNDTYNSNYEALVNACDILSKYQGNRKIAVLGDVLELNQYASKIHFDIGKIPDLKSVDFLFLHGENAKYIQDGAIESGFAKERIFYFEDKIELEEKLLSFLESGDVVLVKASNGMHFEEIVEKIKESYLE